MRKILLFKMHRSTMLKSFGCRILTLSNLFNFVIFMVRKEPRASKSVWADHFYIALLR